MKKVYGSSDQVIHLWANKSQSEARCGNVFFQDDKIYSYGTHYLLGQHVKHNGQDVVLINSSGYSVTTSKHIAQVSMATRHLNQVRCGTGEINVRAGLVSMQDDFINHLMEILSQTKQTFFARENIKDFNVLTTDLGFPELAIDLTSELISIVQEHIEFRKMRNSELNSPENQAKRQVKELVKTQKDVQSWRLGGPLLNSVRNLDPQLMRVVNNEVQTSRGATVPLVDALKLLRLVETNKAQGAVVGDFEFTKKVGDIVTIGCHKISLNEAKEVLKSYITKLTLVG